VEIFDPESYCTDIYTDPDEQKSNLVWEDTRVRLLDNDKSTVLYETVYPVALLRATRDGSLFIPGTSAARIPIIWM
jgi:hypothetical protein